MEMVSYIVSFPEYSILAYSGTGEILNLNQEAGKLIKAGNCTLEVSGGRTMWVDAHHQKEKYIVLSLCDVAAISSLYQLYKKVDGKHQYKLQNIHR